jgi:hypothetical protein
MPNRQSDEILCNQGIRVGSAAELPHDKATKSCKSGQRLELGTSDQAGR